MVSASVSTLRSPICVVVGHVDHGKSSILDYFRNSNIVSAEAGAITQAIGASIIPKEIIKQKCGALLAAMKMDLTIPGLLFIDTPGHAAFSSLRHRGGSLADIAIVVIDIEEGLMPQTVESVKILREYKTPFLVAVNKLDTLRGYKTCKQTGVASVLGNINTKQDPELVTRFETKMYQIVQQLYELEFPAERFDRVADFTKEVALVPTSAIQGDGMAELLMVLCALAQKYLDQQLKTVVDGPARGTILEVKEQKGLGVVMDTIVYDGTLHVNDTIVIGHFDGPIVTKIRALFVPTTVTDMRDKKSKFVSVQSAVAATGIRVSAPGIDNVMAGMPVYACDISQVEATKEVIELEVSKNRIETDEKGIIMKADTIGSLEAMLVLCRQEGISVRVASVGEVSKKDLLDAESNKMTDPSYAAILGFNIPATSLPLPLGVKVITAPVIYHLIEEYKAWKKKVEDASRAATLGALPKLCKFKVLPGYVFRQSNPAIVGISVLAGTVTQGMVLIKQDSSRCGYVRALQENKASISEAKKDAQVACSIDGVTMGRQLFEGDILYTAVDAEQFIELKDKKDLLSADERDILRDIADIMRKTNPVWGM